MSTKRKADIDCRAANRQRVMKSGAEAERDSGFSDASSENTSTMDTAGSEDSPRPFVQRGAQSRGSGPQASQLAVVGGSYSGLSPMIIMNNVLLKQPGENPPALKPWGFSPTMEVVQQPQVVFLQPVVSRQASSASKEASRHRRPKKYLPILKSYPKIAPHPGDSSGSSGRGTASSSSSASTSSSVSGSERGGSLTSSHRDHCQREKQQRSLSGGASNSGSTTPALPGKSPLLQSQLSLPSMETGLSGSPSQERPSSAASQLESECPSSLSFSRASSTENLSLADSRAAAQESGSSGEHGHSDSDADTRRKRFCNTYNILSKSGLLDITLRTKELLRQNRRTQNDLDRLKEQTDLFLQALRSGDTSVCVKLYASLQEDDGEREKDRVAHASLQAD